MSNPVSQAIVASGGVTKLARRLHVSYQAVRKWERALEMGKFQRLPAERAVQLEIATEGRVSREELRPDLYAGMTRKCL